MRFMDMTPEQWEATVNAMPKKNFIGTSDLAFGKMVGDPDIVAHAEATLRQNETWRMQRNVVRYCRDIRDAAISSIDAQWAEYKLSRLPVAHGKFRPLLQLAPAEA